MRLAQLRLVGGRYELGGVVGRGGMAEVYRARDVRLGRVVAVKTLRDDLARDEACQARFRREAQSAASLNHPSIIAVYDTGEDTTGGVRVPYIVMEYVDGRTLGDLLGEGTRLRSERAAGIIDGVLRALKIVDGVLRALDYSHRNGIVHRDIKPSNVMLTRSGDVKVMDFGIARSLAGGQVTMTQTAQVIGTAQYMSPEQARGERVDARSDLYSAGCLLYELLTGRPPFSGDSPVAIAYQHVRESPVPPSQIDPQIPRWADAVALKAMAKSPADRYQNAAEMRAGIQRAMSGMPVPPPASQQAQRPGGPATVALPGAAIPGFAYRAGEDPPRKGRRRAALWALSGLVALAAAITAAYLVLAPGGVGYAIPDVRGLTQQQASAKIVASHLQPQFLDRNSESVQKGRVIATSPAGGAMIPAGSVVAVFLSAGRPPSATAAPIAAPSPPPPRVSVPNVVGDDVGTARATLTEAGLHAHVKADTTATAPKDTVVRQSPPGGTAVNPGSDVTIYISGGGITVQDVRGDPATTAKTILGGQGFTVTEVDQTGPSSAAVGTVYAQNPAAGTLLAQGGTVTIYVQPAPLQPHFSGMLRSQTKVSGAAVR